MTRHDWKPLPLRSRRTDPGSSIRAARKAEPRAGVLARAILDLIRLHPGLEARAIAQALNRQAYEVRKRTADLRDKYRLAHSHEPKVGELTWWPHERGLHCPKCRQERDQG